MPIILASQMLSWSRKTTSSHSYTGKKSVEEQNLVTLTWALLTDDRFQNLRSVIYVLEAELMRFRQLVVSPVTATDIMDKEIKASQNARWGKSSNGIPIGREENQNINRKPPL
ncbi:hypothetical protein ACA910_011153 [Epithemia clementina (nom. ined.)]